ncbi:MAG: YIP1 family protein [Planctomycetota bacterium]
MEELNGQALNPWVSIWTKPRATIQQIVNTDPERLVLLLAAIAGAIRVLDRASAKDLGDKIDWSVIFLIAAIAGPVGGIISLYIGGALIRWTGTCIGGMAPAQHIRAAMAWSSVPVIWVSVVWIPELALFGREMFTSKMPSLDANPSLGLALFGFAAIEVIGGIWAGIVFLKCLGQVQGFSAWKALGNAILAGLVIAVPIVAIVIAVVVLSIL